MTESFAHRSGMVTVLAGPGGFRLLGEEVSERLRVKPTALALALEIIRRLTLVRKNQMDA